MHVALQRGATKVAGTQSDGHERGDYGTSRDLRDPVDYDLTVGDVHARLDDHGIADGDLADRDGQPMGESWEKWNPKRLEPRFDAVEGLGAEPIAGPCEPDDLGDGVEARTEDEPLAPVLRGQARIGKQGLPEPGVACVDVAPEGGALVQLGLRSSTDHGATTL